MPTVNSNVKLITSNQAPTTSNLAKGEMAFGQVAGINSIYGNTGNGIIKIEFTASGEPIIYFANEDALTTFVDGDDVPASGWYAAIADSIYEQYGEWVAYKITFEDIGASARVYKPHFTQIGASSNGNAFYNLVPNESGIFTDGDVFYWFDGIIDTINMGNYAHTRYFLYSTNGYSDSRYGLDVRLSYKQKSGNKYNVDLYQEDFVLEDVGGPALKASIDYNMDNYTGNPGTAPEDNQYFTIWQACMSDSAPFDPLYLVIKEIVSDGEPWINWNEIIALDSGDEPEPTESYVQFDLSSELPLGNYINSVSFSNRQQVGDYPLSGGWNIDLASGSSNNINISASVPAQSQHLRISVDAWIDKFSSPGYAIPDMNVNITYYASTNTHAISGVYDQAKKRISWNGSFEVTDTGETPAIARDNITNLWVAIMRYYDTDSPTLKGTIKFEAIDG